MDAIYDVKSLPLNTAYCSKPDTTVRFRVVGRRESGLDPSIDVENTCMDPCIVVRNEYSWHALFA